MGKATEKQVKPKGKGPAITDLLIRDLAERQAFGIQKYGEPLRTFNGRDPLADAYQELIDLLVYLRQYMEESKTERAAIMARMLRQAAEDAYQSEVIDTGMETLTIGKDSDYADKEDWKDGWLLSLQESVGDSDLDIHSE